MVRAQSNYSTFKTVTWPAAGVTLGQVCVIIAIIILSWYLGNDRKIINSFIFYFYVLDHFFFHLFCQPAEKKKQQQQLNAKSLNQYYRKQEQLQYCIMIARCCKLAFSWRMTFFLGKGTELLKHNWPQLQISVTTLKNILRQRCIRNN